MAAKTNSAGETNGELKGAALTNAYQAASGVWTESGLSLQQVIFLRFMSGLAPEESVDPHFLEQGLRQAIDQPTLLSQVIVKELQEKFISRLGADAQDRLKRLVSLWQMEETIRRRLEYLPETHGSLWVEEDLIAVSHDLPAWEQVRFLVAGQFLRDRIAALLKRLPSDDFATQFSLEERPLVTESVAAAKAFYAVSGCSVHVPLLPGSERGRLPISLLTQLRDPERFFSRQRQRTYIFATLIVLAAGAALAGFASSYHSFQRQIQLSQLRSNFVSSVSHELRAPIASMRLLAEGLYQEKITDPARRSEYYYFLVQECRRLGTLIDNILNFSRIDRNKSAYQFEPIHLPDLIDTTLKLMGPVAADKGVELTLDYPERVLPEGLQLVGDGGAIHQALINLIDNALKHSREGQKVRVALALHQNEGATWVAVSVRDEGPGIAREEQGRIFDPFYRLGSELRRETQGIGIGLTIVQHVAQAHGGRVEVQSEPGSGSEFKLWLPLRKTTE